MNEGSWDISGLTCFNSENSITLFYGLFIPRMETLFLLLSPNIYSFLIINPTFSAFFVHFNFRSYFPSLNLINILNSKTDYKMPTRPCLPQNWLLDAYPAMPPPNLTKSCLPGHAFSKPDQLLPTRLCLQQNWLLDAYPAMPSTKLTKSSLPGNFHLVFSKLINSCLPGHAYHKHNILNSSIVSE